MEIDLEAYFDKISKLKMAHRVLIFAGTLVILMGLFIGLIYRPKTTEIDKIESELETLEGEIMIAERTAKKKEKLDMELATMQEQLKYALSYLPTTREIPNLLKSITELGNDSHLEFLLFSPEKEIPKEFYVEIPVSVEVRGGYHDVAIFFDKIGKLDRIVNVSNVTMIPIKANSTNLKTTCKAVTYRFKEEKKAKGVPKKKK
jgi:type IV pilus assembly protein PilO